MKTYALIFRMDITTKSAQPSAAQMKIYMEQWGEWINFLAKGNNLAEGGNHFSSKGKVLRPKNKVEDGVYVVKKESVAGYVLIHAKNMTEAVKLGKKCPILDGKGTSVEVREVAGM